MLADTVEAAVRSMSTKTEEEIKEKIDKLVNAKMREGQLDCCDLTFQELNKIKQAFVSSYKGISHQRIEYPELDFSDLEGKEENKNGSAF